MRTKAFEAKAPQLNSRDIIISAIKEFDKSRSEAPRTDAEFADHIIRRLAAKHLHIVKSKGSELVRVDRAEQPRPEGTYTEWLRGETVTDEPFLDTDWRKDTPSPRRKPPRLLF